MMKFFDPKRHLPPGKDWDYLRTGLILGHAASLLSLFAFLTRYAAARNALFSLVQQLDGTTVRQLIPGRMITPFWELMAGTPLAGAGIFLMLMLTLVNANYRHFTTGSMSVYLMRRLPDPWERHRRCWTVPVLASVLEIGLYAVFIFLCWLLYRFVTPAGHLPM